MTSVPLIKASYFQGNIDALSVLGPREAEARERLRSIIDGARAASRADWLPMAWDYELTRVAHSLGGRDAVIELNRRSLLAAVEGPFLRPVVQGAFRLFGVSPQAVLKVVRNAWGAGTKDAGVMTATTTDTGGVVTLAEVVAESIWYEGLIGVLAGVFEITSHTGTSSLEIEPPSTARLTCTWSKKQR